MYYIIKSFIGLFVYLGVIRSLGWVFNSRSGFVDYIHLFWYEGKLANLELKTKPKHYLDHIPLGT